MGARLLDEPRFGTPGRDAPALPEAPSPEPEVRQEEDRRVTGTSRNGRGSERRRRRRGRHGRRGRANRHLVDALTPRQRRLLAGLIIAWVGWAAWGGAWWLRPVHVTSATSMTINTVLLGIEMVVLPLWFYWWLWRMKRADRRLELPDLRTAMVVTKAPSEPWEMVRETLEAMLRQDFGAPYDVWLADEQVAPETRTWCEANGVRISTREGRADYHRAAWPRRTRCKEGNLAFFYDHWGYDLYDVVVQLDADHVPERDYLRRMVTPFHDEHVGYVAAPSICDRNAEHSWSARGRLYAEATLHGPMQAGHSGGYAPSCIGSHYAVRTQALKEIGGLGPELAEDFTTTLMMSSYGWQGVFAVDAEAHGYGPDCLADCLKQEFQWSRSMMNVLLTTGRPYFKTLSRRAKLRLGFCQIWYPLFALLMLASVVGPVVAVATRTPFVRVGLGDFYLHMVPAIFVLLLTVLWLRGLEWLRPRSARAFSWEAVLFQVVRWPWALIGCLASITEQIRGREVTFAVTPKGRTGVAPLPLRILAPPLLLALISAIPWLLHLDGGAAHGYRKLAMVNVVLYLATALAIVALHVAEHSSELRGRASRAAAPKLVATVALGVVIAMGSALGPSFSSRPQLAAATPWPIGPPRTPALGVTTDALAENSFRTWTPSDLDAVSAFERATRMHQDIVMWFADWEHTRPNLAQLRAVAARGSTPAITWEPWDYEVGLHQPQPKYTLRSIADGEHDAYIRSWAQALRSFGQPVQLRFAQEMNGVWYPWSERGNGNRRGDFVAAWRHVHDLFATVGARNVQWVWSPVATGISASLYPGAEYVDIVGLSGFNGGTTLQWSGWRSFRSIFGDDLDRLERIAPGKPVQISEVGSVEAGGSKARWIQDMFAYLRTRPEVGSVLWFDVDKQADWRVETSPASARAYAEGAARRERVRENGSSERTQASVAGAPAR